MSRWASSKECRGGFKVGDKVSVRGGWFTGKPWKRSTPGVITGFPGCGVAEVKVDVAGYDRGSRFDIGVSDLTKRRR